GPHHHHHHARPRGGSCGAAHSGHAGRAPGPRSRGMSLLHTIETGLRSLLGHRLRSVLTTLGILFGVAAVISTVGIGQASSESATTRISCLGTSLLTIAPGITFAGGVFGGGGSANTLTMAEVAGLMDRQNAPD